MNIIGLALGFAAFILIGLFVQYELSWDKWNVKYDRIYRIQRHYAKTLYAMDGNDISPHSRPITAQLLERRFPEFEKITVTRENGGKFLSAVAERQIYDEKGYYADSCFFDVFSFHFLEGTQTGALNDPFSIVLSKAMADKFMTNWEGGNQDEKINCRFNRINHDFIGNMNIRLVAGRDFSRQFPGDTGRGCLINETAARCFGWDNPIGMRLNNDRLTVVGVVKDFVYKDLHNGIEPAVMILAPEEILGNRTFAFRVDPARLGEARAILTREFENTFPNDPFEFNYLSFAATRNPVEALRYE